MLVVRAHGHERLPDSHAGHGPLRLPESAPHPRLSFRVELDVNLSATWNIFGSLFEI